MQAPKKPWRKGESRKGLVPGAWKGFFPTEGRVPTSPLFQHVKVFTFLILFLFFNPCSCQYQGGTPLKRPFSSRQEDQLFAGETLKLALFLQDYFFTA
jgi:hypothetical protein